MGAGSSSSFMGSHLGQPLTITYSSLKLRTMINTAAHCSLALWSTDDLITLSYMDRSAKRLPSTSALKIDLASVR